MVHKVTGATGATGAIGPQGVTGLDGNFGGATFEYLFDTSTAATDPSATYLRLNDVSQNVATELYIDSLDISGSSIDMFMMSIDSVSSVIKGYVRLTNKFDSTQFLLFQITDLTNNGGWWTIDVTNQAFSDISPFTNNEDILASFVTSGNKGDIGATGPQGATGLQGVTGPSNPNATSVTITDTNNNATYYPVFVDSSGVSKTLFIDSITTPFSVNPNTGDFNVVDTLKLTQNQVALGKNAGTTTQGANAVAIGFRAGNATQSINAVAIGNDAGNATQGNSGVAIGHQAGNSGQLANAVAIGDGAGYTTQGTNAVAIGNDAGYATQATNAVAIGDGAGYTTQGTNAVAIGASAGNNAQGNNAVAIGHNAGAGTTTGQGANSIAIGLNAGVASQTAGSICLNASGVALNPSVAGFYVNPIRNDSSGNTLVYNTSTNEVTYGTQAQLLPALINIIYPIGAIIQSSVSTNPGTYITGTTWVAYSAGQVLVGKAGSGTFVTAGSTGGAESNTIVANNLPTHTHPATTTSTDSGHSHSIQRSNVAATLVGVDASVVYQTLANTGTTYTSTQDGNAVITSTTTVSNNTTTNTAFNVLQPYIVVYTWTRTA